MITPRNGQSQVNPLADVLTVAHEPPQIEHPHVLIAGLGNILMQDDGVGVHAVRRLSAVQLSRHALAVEIGTAALDSTAWLAWADWIFAIDAIQAGHPPGTVYRIDQPTDAGNAGLMSSVHDVNLFGALAMLPEIDRPNRIVMLGVEPAIIDYGLDLSPKVAASMPAVIDHVRHAVTEFPTAPARR